MLCVMPIENLYGNALGEEEERSKKGGEHSQQTAERQQEEQQQDLGGHVEVISGST